MLVVVPARLPLAERRRERQPLRFRVGDELGIHAVARFVHEIGDAQFGELLHLRGVSDVRDDRNVLLLRLVDDGFDDVGRETLCRPSRA